MGARNAAGGPGTSPAEIVEICEPPPHEPVVVQTIAPLPVACVGLSRGNVARGASEAAQPLSGVALDQASEFVANVGVVGEAVCARAGRAPAPAASAQNAASAAVTAPASGRALALDRRLRIPT